MDMATVASPTGFWPQHFEASVLLLLVFLLDPKGCLISYTLAGLASYIRKGVET